MKRIILSIPFLLLALSSVNAQSEQSEKPFVSFTEVTTGVTELKILSNGFLRINRDTGKFYAVKRDSKEVLEYDPISGELLGTFTSEVGVIRDILFKGNYLICTFRSSHTSRDTDASRKMEIFDLTTKKSLKSFKLDHVIAEIWATPSRKNSYFYVAFPTPAQKYQTKQYDLKTQTLVGTIQILQTEALQKANIYADEVLFGGGGLGKQWYHYTPDGKYFATRAHEIRKSNQMVLGTIDEEKRVFNYDRADIENVESLRSKYIIPAAGSDGWYVGDRKYPIDLSGPGVPYDYGAEYYALHPTLDLGAYPSEKDVTFFAASTGKELKKISGLTIRMHTKYRPGGHHFGTYNQTFFAGPKYEFLCTTTGSLRTAIIFQLDKLNLEIGKRIETPTIASKHYATVNKPFSAPLFPAPMAGKYQCTLQDGAPAGLKITGATLQWTPTAAQQGSHGVSVEVKSAEGSRQLTTTIQVTSPRIQLDFNLQGAKFNAAGTQAICWGTTSENVLPVRTAGVDDDSVAPDCYLALIDIATGRRVNIPVGQDVNVAYLDHKYYYYIFRDSSVLHRRELADVGATPTTLQDYFLGFPAKDIIPLAGNQVFITQTFTSNSWSRSLSSLSAQLRMLACVFDLHTFEKSKVPYLQNPTEYGPRLDRGCIFFRNPLTVTIGEMAISRQSGMAQTFCSSPYLPQLVSWCADVSQHKKLPKVIQGKYIVAEPREFRNSLAGFRGGMVALSPSFVWGKQQSTGSRFDFPITAAKNPILRRMSNRYPIRVDCATAGTLNFYSAENREQIGSANEVFQGEKKVLHPVLELQGQNILVGWGNVIKPLTFPKEVLEKAKMPLQILYPSALLAPADKPLTIPIRTAGGSGEKTFDLISFYGGIEVHSKTGAITIDVPTLWKEKMKEPEVPEGLTPERLQRSLEMRAKNKFTQWDRARKRFKLFSGIEISENEMVYQLPIAISVEDTSGGKDELVFYVVIRGRVQ